MRSARCRRGYPDYARAAAALTRYLETWRGRLRRWWLVRRGRDLRVVACPDSDDGSHVHFHIHPCLPEAAVWGRQR
ncbi:hypothetical protein [Goodfellowiella coeruleoviolacea]|uniref:HIT domain-containing protein n=1 Tax=Goodfellowiella coeruleoviolacea TaxID=334858 RepID=A0AAE3GJ49_9PSEU|nr:hypothetical protein [Goodfellowiella coeruleoviolacea]MCP2169120.1 hypothetical protein [Goodfellowiella coeruleoviolacea]